MNNLKFDSGSVREGKTRYRTSGVDPRHDTLTANAGEGIGSITLRAYGANTTENRQKIRNANASLTGEIRVPR